MNKNRPDSGSSIQFDRYQHQIRLPQVGLEGQEKLKHSSVLVIGAGGLGCPALLYLTAAGVGRLGIVDSDTVELSNLHRQVLYTTQDIGQPKTQIAKQRLHVLNPEVTLETWQTRLTHTNAQDILMQYDIVLDGTDNFFSRYLINDACVLLHKPCISGAVQSFEGQVSVFNVNGSACYRCLFPTPPPPEFIPNCNEAGILGVLPGWVGLTQATETLKLILGIGEPLVQKLLIYDALTQTQNIISFPKNPSCISCGTQPTLLSLQDSQKNLEGHEGCMTIPTISLKELQEKFKNPQSLAVIDVRTHEEVSLGILPGAKHIPLDRWSDLSVIQEIKKLSVNHEVIVYCASGVRSHKACVMLQQAGIQASNYAGGYPEWTSHTTQL